MAKRLKVSRKDLLKEPDQFLSGSEKAMLYYTDNRGTVIGVVAMILIAGSSFFNGFITGDFSEYNEIFLMSII